MFLKFLLVFVTFSPTSLRGIKLPSDPLKFLVSLKISKLGPLDPINPLYVGKKRLLRYEDAKIDQI